MITQALISFDSNSESLIVKRVTGQKSFDPYKLSMIPIKVKQTNFRIMDHGV